MDKRIIAVSIAPLVISLAAQPRRQVKHGGRSLGRPNFLPRSIRDPGAPRDQGA